MSNFQKEKGLIEILFITHSSPDKFYPPNSREFPQPSRTIPHNAYPLDKITDIFTMNPKEVSHMSKSNPFPGWDATQEPAVSINRLYDWTTKETEDMIDWYSQHRLPRKFGSQLIRALVIIFAGAGALCPFLDATKAFSKLALGEWGYVFFGLAAAVFLFDKFFGLSSGWMRFMVTTLQLERALNEFQFDWVDLNIRKASPQKFIERLKTFALLVNNLVQQETTQWVSEFMNNIEALDKLIKSRGDSKQDSAGTTAPETDASTAQTSDQAAATKEDDQSV